MMDKFLSIDEVAECLNVDYQLVYKLVRAGKMPAVKIGRVYRIRMSGLEAYLDSNMTGAVGGGTCSHCGTHYNSKQSLRESCTECEKPICYECWHRLGIRKCKDHE